MLRKRKQLVTTASESIFISPGSLCQTGSLEQTINLPKFTGNFKPLTPEVQRDPKLCQEFYTWYLSLSFSVGTS